MKTESLYEYSARISRNYYLKRAVIALLVALPFIVEAVVIYANAKTEEDIWGAVVIFAFGMVWAIPSIVNFKDAYWWHRFGAQRLEAIDKWIKSLENS